MPSLKQAVVGGQYEFPKGLFWGGAELERGPSLLLDAAPRWLHGCERIVWIDLHTGLGRSGNHALLVDAPSDSQAYARIRVRFGDRVQPWSAGESVAYKIRGGLPEALQRTFGDRIEVLTQEFGTNHAIQVLGALRAENRAVHWGGDVEGAKRALLDAFRPHLGAWRARVVQDGLDTALHACGQV
jgi:hypothetical protein